MNQMSTREKKYMFVDLDGTFAKNDLFQELLFKRLCRRPVSTLKGYLRGGILGLKHLVFHGNNFSTDQILVNDDVLKLIQKKKAIGYSIFLATASPQAYADYVLNTWSVFDFARGSDQKINLKGQAKLDFILSISKGAHVEYIGDSKADQIIFRECVCYYKLTNNQIYEFIN